VRLLPSFLFLAAAFLASRQVLTHAEVQRWLTGLDTAPASVEKTHRVLSMVLAYAVKDGRLATNPAAAVSLPRVRQAEKRFLSHQQVRQLAGACAGCSRRRDGRRKVVGAT
jgi:site-specific recombinase XerD